MNTSKKFKIAVVNSYYYPDIVGGAEVVVKILAETYRKLGHEVFVITSGKEDRVDDVNGIRVYRVKNRNLYWGKESKSQIGIKKIFWHLVNVNNPFVKKKVEDILSKEKPDIVHTNNLGELSFGILETISKSGAKILHTLHDYSFMCVNSMMFKDLKNCDSICPRCSVYASLKKKFTKYVDYLVGVSKFIVERHRQNGFFIDKEFSVIYNPVTVKVGDLKEKNCGNIIFGFIGRLHPSKGVELLIKVFMKSKKNLLIAGTPYNTSYGDYLTSLTKSKNIKFLGWMSAEKFYEIINVLIVPSLWFEPLTTVVHDANAFGIPVIASNRGGLPEIIIQDVNGFLFDPDRPIELLNIIEHINSKTLSSMTHSARQEAMKFIPEIVTRQYLNIMSALTL